MPKGGGKPLAEVALQPKIADRTSSSYFPGTWTYTYKESGKVTKTGAFTIGGADDESGFGFDLEEANDEAVPYYSDLENKVDTYLVPDPLQDGTQRYITKDGDVTLEKVK